MRNLRHAAALLVATTGLGLGCTPAGSDAKGAKGPVSQQQRIVNISPIDLGSCFLQPPAIPDKVNADVLTGVLAASRPVVLECLVDPKNRGGEGETEVTIKSTFSAGGKVDTAVTGKNTTPAGEQCVRAAVDKLIGQIPNLAAKAPAGNGPVSAQVQFTHVAGVSPTVKMGISEASDVAGTIRLAEPTFCDCYAAWKSAEPHTLKAKIKLMGDGKTPPAVTIDPTQDATADQVAACLTPKVAALPLKTTSTELTAPYTFSFVNSAQDAPFTASTPDLAFAQLEALRSQRQAAGAIAVGARTIAAEAYVAAIDKYKAKPERSLEQGLTDGCNALVAADDNWIAAMEKVLDVEEKTLALLTDLANKDPQWAKAKDLAVKAVDDAKKDVETAKKAKPQDQDACPKMK
jgi:hypothetical protein